MTYMELFLANALYQERIRKIELAYRFRSLRPNPVITFSGFRNFLGNLLIGSGQRLKGSGYITYVGT